MNSYIIMTIIFLTMALKKLNFNNFTDILEIDFEDKKLLKIVDIFGKRQRKIPEEPRFTSTRGVVEKKIKY